MKEKDYLLFTSFKKEKGIRPETRRAKRRRRETKERVEVMKPRKEKGGEGVGVESSSSFGFIVKGRRVKREEYFFLLFYSSRINSGKQGSDQE